MANTIKQIGIKDSSGSGYDNRDIGAEAQNVEVSFNSQGEIIEDITEPGVVVAETKGASEVVKDLQDQIDDKAPAAHTNVVANGNTLGHIKIGSGLSVSNGVAAVNFVAAGGTDSNKAVPGSDARLSNARKNPNPVTFSNGTATTVVYDGSTDETVSYTDVGAAPINHASSSTTYGVASTSNYGHVKFGTTAGTAAQGNDSRLSNARKNPYSVTFSNGATTPTTVVYDGSEAKTISYSDVGAPPKSHIASGTTYGGATASYYGHAKLSDTYDSLVSGGAAANGVAASQNALYNAYNELNNNKENLYGIKLYIPSNTYTTIAKTLQAIKVEFDKVPNRIKPLVTITAGGNVYHCINASDGIFSFTTTTTDTSGSNPFMRTFYISLTDKTAWYVTVNGTVSAMTIQTALAQNAAYSLWSF